LALDVMSRVGSRVRTIQLLILAATVALACDLNAQARPGRSTRILLSDSIWVIVHLGGADTSGKSIVVMYTPEGIFHLRADSSAMAAWAKATASLPGPTSQSNGKTSFSATILRATDESGNAMRLTRLSGDSLPVYALAGSNGAWEFSAQIPAEKVSALLHAIGGSNGDDLTWEPYGPIATSREPGYRPAEMAPGNPRPQYPKRAELRGAAGEVSVQFTVDQNGRVPRKSILILRSTHPLFSLAVRDAILSMRYFPATRSGVPVESGNTQLFVFRIP
jgi:TonB family protein